MSANERGEEASGAELLDFLLAGAGVTFVGADGIAVGSDPPRVGEVGVHRCEQLIGRQGVASDDGGFSVKVFGPWIEVVRTNDGDAAVDECAFGV